MIIEFDCFLMRPICEEDIPHLYDYRNNKGVLDSLGGFSKGLSKKDLEGWLEYHRQKDNEIVWCIEDASIGKCLGYVGLYSICGRTRQAEFAILIGDTNYRRVGLGEKVATKVLDYSKNYLNLRRIYLTVLESNVAAVNLYKKLGLRVEGTEVDAEYRNGSYVNVLRMATIFGSC